MATPYQRFYEAIKSPATRKTYTIYINKFLEYAHIDFDGLVKLPKREIEELVFNYVIHLKNLTERTGIPSPNSYNSMLSPIQLFLEQNDILLNWKKIKRLYPTRIQTANQLPYTDDDVRDLLEATTSIRNKAFIHFLASTGCRVGAMPILKIEDIKPIEGGALVTIYRDSIEEYRTCLTPEAYGYLKKYLAQRIHTGDESPLFTSKSNLKPLTDYTAKDVIRHIRKQAKLSVDNGRKTKRGKSQNHAFRKRFEICLANADIQSKFIEYMMGHFTAQDKYYFRGVSDENLYFQFKRAIPILTLDKTDKIEAEKNEEIRIINETHNGELKEKLENQDELLQKMMLQLASTKYFMYETRYMDCFGGTTPNLKELKKRMTTEEIDDWNSIIPIVQTKYDWRIKDLKTSESTLKKIKEMNEWKALLKDYEKQGKSKEVIESIRNMITDIAEEYDLKEKL